MTRDHKPSPASVHPTPTNRATGAQYLGPLADPVPPGHVDALFADASRRRSVAPLQIGPDAGSSGSTLATCAARPTLIPDSLEVSMDADRATTITVRLTGANPSDRPKWSVLLGDPAAVDLENPDAVNDLSLARTDSVVRVHLVVANDTEATFRLEPQGPIGDRILFFDCELGACGHQIYVNTKRPVRIHVDSKLARWGRTLAAVEARRDRGETVDESERLYARNQVLDEANALAHKEDQPDQVITAVREEIVDEFRKIQAAELRGVGAATTALAESLTSGPDVASMVTTFIEAGLLFAGLFIPGGAGAAAAWKAISLAMKAARPVVKAAGAWLRYSSGHALSAAHQTAAAAAGSLTGVSGKEVVRALHHVMEQGLIAATNTIENQLPVMIAELMAMAPPTADGNHVDYRVGLQMALRHALYGGALEPDGKLDEIAHQKRAAKDMHRMFLTQHARMTRRGALVAIRGSTDHASGVEAARAALGDDPLVEIGSTDLVIAQLLRAAADLGIQIAPDRGAIAAALGAWSDDTVLPASERRAKPERLEGSASYPMVFFDSFPGRWQRILVPRNVVTLEPEFTQQYYLTSADVADVQSWSVELASDVEHTIAGADDPARTHRVFSLRRVQFHAIGRQDARLDRTIKPATPTAFTIVYHLE